MKRIVNSQNFSFFEDSEGRLHRKKKNYRIPALILFIVCVIGGLFCVGDAVINRGDWGVVLPSIIILLLASIPLAVLLEKGKAPKLIFDKPAKTIILQTIHGNEKRIHFDRITRFNIDFEKDDDFPDIWSYDVTVYVKSKRPIKLARFYGKKNRTSQKAEDFVAYLERITRTDLEAKIPPSA